MQSSAILDLQMIDVQIILKHITKYIYGKLRRFWECDLNISIKLTLEQVPPQLHIRL